MRRILSFIVVFFTYLLHSLPFEPDNLLDQFSLEPDPLVESAGTNLDLSYQAADPVDLFSSVEPDDTSLYDPNNPILASDGASSTGSQCVGESMEPINIARSLDSRQSFDTASEGFCLKDGQETTPINLKLPTLDDLNNLDKPNPGGEIPQLVKWPGYFYCAAGDRVQLVCCTGKIQWDSSREGCQACKFQK